jgi:hypothetical protein
MNQGVAASASMSGRVKFRAGVPNTFQASATATMSREGITSSSRPPDPGAAVGG